MDPITVLQGAKKVWDLAHLAGGSAIKSKAGGTYIAIQGATGNALMSAAEQEDTIDEILVGIVGDIVQGIAITLVAGPVVSFRVSAASIITGEGLGNELKNYYKLIKSDDYEYWDYVQNWHNPNTNKTEEYAKILMRKNIDGTYTPVEKAPGIIWSENVSPGEYNQYIDAQNAFYASLYSTELNTLIENSNGVLKVTMPDGTIYAQGDETANTLVGGTKDDYLNGGAGSDTLIGGSGNDTYITDNGDKVYDSDGIGHVEFYGMTLSGGTQMEGVANTYEGNGGVYTLDVTNKVLTFTRGFHYNHNCSNSYGYVNKNIKKEETKLCI
jgi:Ca2+-binding RTX toxin-like protein